MILSADDIFSLLSWLQYIFVRLCTLLGFLSIAPILLLLLMEPVVYIFRLFNDFLPLSSIPPLPPTTNTTTTTTSGNTNSGSGSYSKKTRRGSSLSTVNTKYPATATETIAISITETERFGVTTAIETN